MTDTSRDASTAIDVKNARVGRAPRIIVLASVAVASTVLAYYLLTSVIYPPAPFPSDPTPMSTFEGGVVWQCRASDMTVANMRDVPFSNVSFFIAYPDWGESFEDAGGYSSGVFNTSRAIFADNHDFDYGDPGSFLTTGKDTDQGIVWSTFWIVVSDRDANGIWSPGDDVSIFTCLTLNEEIVEYGYVNDTEYAFAVHLEPGYPLAYVTMEYHFAFHKGKFYSWLPDRALSFQRF